MPDEREELIEPSRLDRRRRRRGLGGLGGGVGRHPVGHGLMHDAEGAAGAAQVHPSDVALDRAAAQVGAIALRPRVRRVFAAADTAQVALTARWGAPVLDLLRTAAAMRTGDHTLLSHAHPCSHTLERTCVG